MENSEGQKVEVCSGASGLTCSVSVRDGHAPAAGGQGAQRPTWHLSRKHVGYWSYVEQLSSATRNRNFPSVLWPKQGHTQLESPLAKSCALKMDRCLWLRVAEQGRVTLRKDASSVLSEVRPSPHHAHLQATSSQCSFSLCPHKDIIRVFLLGGLLRKCKGRRCF